MSNNKKITWKHLERFLTCQEYFVWNDFKTEQIIENDGEEKDFWSLYLDEDQKDDFNYVEVHKTGFNIINDHFIKWIEERYQKEKLSLLIIKEKDIEMQILKTDEAMQNPDIDVILFPVFEYKGALSKPTLLNKNKKLVSNLNLNTSTKKKNYIKAFFDFEIITKNNFEISDFSILTIEIKDFKKNDVITFDETFYANTGVSKPKAKTKTITSLREAALGWRGENSKTILQKILDRELLDLKANSKKEQISFSGGIDYYIDRINDAKKAKRLPIGKNDITPWGSNKFFREIVSEDYPDLLPLSGTLLKNKEIIRLVNQEHLLEIFYDSYEPTKNIKNKRNVMNYKMIEEFLDLLDIKSVVWYDFEGFSLPFPIMEFTLPYQQLVFQVSVIKTKMDKITSVSNVVIDPKDIEYFHFFEIIDAIYDESANSYVVFNKTYENSKLLSMSEIFYKQKLFKQDASFTKKVEEYDKKIETIISKTIDLLDLFKVNSLNGNLPPIFLWELYGFSSIKAIEKYITQNNYILEVMIEPYSKLNIQNGLMAMTKAVDRRLGGIGDKEWEEVTIELKRYCENDVRAMLMVYHFAKKILEEK
ncbi:MAG: DUF2779 domain-containing protein [Metamycoplasmataceae bacterium]